jgi:hypothetical protein
MKYSCDHCPYETDKKANYLRHINRKFRCNNRCVGVNVEGNIVDVERKIVDVERKIVDVEGKIVDVEGKNIDDKGKNVDDGSICTKCNKRFKSKKGLSNHFDTCEGLSKLQCNTCLKFFSSASSKSHHKRKVLCFPPPPPSPSQPASEPFDENKDDDNTNERSLLAVNDNQDCRIINNTNTNNSQTHNTNNSHNTNTNNINIKVENNNNFAYNYLGNEDVSYIANKPNVLQTLKSYGKKGIYGIGDIINSIICNPEHPENSTLLKPKEYGTDVLVRDCNDSNKLEFCDISDAMETIKNKALPRYLQGVCDYIKNNNITRLPDLKEKGLLRKLIHIMIVLDIDVPEELEHIVDIDDDKVDQDRSNEALCSSHNTKLNKSVARSAYEFTKQNYKKKNGTYVMKK